MRILMVSAYFESHRGGIEVVVGQLARAFRRAGQSVTWVASNATGGSNGVMRLHPFCSDPDLQWGRTSIRNTIPGPWD